MEKISFAVFAFAVLGGFLAVGCQDPGIPANIPRRQVFQGTPQQDIEHIQQNSSLSDVQKSKFIADIKKRNHLP